MKRQLLTQGIILRAERSGEINKSVTAFSPDLGIVHGMAFGAAKPGSRFSGATEPFRFAAIHLYHNPVSNSYKITDLEILAISTISVLNCPVLQGLPLGDSSQDGKRSGRS